MKVYPRLTPFLLLLLALTATGAFGAERGVSCFERFRGWFLAKKPALSPEAQADWTRAFGRYGIERGNLLASPLLQYAERDALFWTLYRELPESVRQLLRQAPQGPYPAQRFFADVSNRYGTSVPNFLSLIRARYADGVLPVAGRTSYADWERQGLAQLDALERANPSLIAQHHAEIARMAELDRARDFWIHGAGMQTLPVVTEAGREWVVLGAEKLAVRRHGRTLEVRVPKERIAIRADNPISTEKLIGQMRAGVPAPRFYDGHVGLDGRFYLDDGHHRLQTDGRALIPVRIVDPPHTLNLNVMFDFLGLKQPSAEDLVRFQAGQIPLRELFPRGGQRFLDELRLLPAELRN